MSAEAFEHETEVPVTAYGAQRKADWYAGMQARSDVMNEMLSGAGQAGHADTSRQLRAAHQGLFGDATPQELGQAVAERQAVVGSAYGGRPLERNGGLYDHHVTAPHPARVDLRHVHQPGGAPAGDQMSPLAAYMRNRDQ